MPALPQHLGRRGRSSRDYIGTKMPAHKLGDDYLIITQIVGRWRQKFMVIFSYRILKSKSSA